jgi:flagellar motor switch protein FliM
MNEILSTDEIAALVAAAKDGQLPVGSGERRHSQPRRVRDVDFSRPAKFTQDQQRRIERAHDAFCRSTGTRLSAELRLTIEFEVINIDQLTWSSAINDLPPGSIFGIVGTAPLGTHFVLSAEAPAVVWMIERVLGGGADTDPSRIVQRELTEIELALTRRLFATIVSQLALTWEELAGLGLSLVQVETLATNLQVAPPSEPTLVLTIEMRAEGISSTMSLLVPWRSIEAVSGKLTASHYGDALGEAETDEATASAVRHVVGEAEVEVRAQVGGVELSVERVLELKRGDVVPLGSRAASGIVLCVEGVPVHRAQPGRSGSRRAVSVLERLEGVE